MKWFKHRCWFHRAWLIASSRAPIDNVFSWSQFPAVPCWHVSTVAERDNKHSHTTSCAPRLCSASRVHNKRIPWVNRVSVEQCGVCWREVWGVLVTHFYISLFLYERVILRQNENFAPLLLQVFNLLKQPKMGSPIWLCEINNFPKALFIGNILTCPGRKSTSVTDIIIIMALFHLSIPVSRGGEPDGKILEEWKMGHLNGTEPSLMPSIPQVFSFFYYYLSNLKSKCVLWMNLMDLQIYYIVT